MFKYGQNNFLHCIRMFCFLRLENILFRIENFTNCGSNVFGSYKWRKFGRKKDPMRSKDFFGKSQAFWYQICLENRIKTFFLYLWRDHLVTFITFCGLTFVPVSPNIYVCLMLKIYFQNFRRCNPKVFLDVWYLHSWLATKLYETKFSSFPIRISAFWKVSKFFTSEVKWVT